MSLTVSLPIVRPRDSFQLALILLLLLNFADALFTLHWVTTGVATEANPVMAWALDHGAEFFLLSKLLIVTSGVALLWRHADRPSVRLAAVPAFVLYSLVVGMHVGAAFLHGP